MTEDYTPIGPSTPQVEAQEPVSGRSLSGKKTLFIGCGGCFVIVVLSVFFGGWALVQFGFGVFADEIENILRTNRVVIEQIGRIEDFELDLGASMAEPGDDDFVFRVSGTRGSGLVTATCVTSEDGIEEVVAGTIQLESGETLDLFPEDEEIDHEVVVSEETG